MTLLELDSIAVRFRSRPRPARVLRDVSLTISRGEIVGLVGESGSGKTTLGRVAAGLQAATSGAVRIDGLAVTPRDMRKPALRRRVQVVFQHPDESLTPTVRVETALAEPLIRLGGYSKGDADRRVDELLQEVGLGAAFRNRLPRTLSGGQQQRVAIARALACEPDLLVLDEPTASLDRAVETRITDLLTAIRAERGLAMLYISHDLRSVGRLVDRVAVMYAGRLVDVGSPSQTLHAPVHPYTKALSASSPSLLGRTAPRFVLAGETPSPASLPDGCAFAGRCSYVMPICRDDDPELSPRDASHWVACHAVETEHSVNGRSDKSIPRRE